jgi:antitoxin component HigA of HigAB toxin-antitoxin module
MDKRNDDLQGQRAYEQAVHRYISALDRGDFETVIAVLAQAEHDAELERMIVEVNEVLEAEHEAATNERDAAQVRALLHEHLPSGFASDDEMAELPPLTVAAVAARMSEDAAQRGHATTELVALVQQLDAVDRALPDELTLGAVRQLLSDVGVPASAAMIKLFRETAIYLAQGREHGEAYRAAARRQRATQPRPDRVRNSDQTGRDDQEGQP